MKLKKKRNCICCKDEKMPSTGNHCYNCIRDWHSRDVKITFEKVKK